MSVSAGHLRYCRFDNNSNKDVRDEPLQVRVSSYRSQSFFGLFVGVVSCLLVGVVLCQVVFYSVMAKTSFLMRDRQKELVLLLEENDELQSRVLRESGIGVLGEKAKSLGLVKTDRVGYISISDNSVVSD